jgi:hypothetical protein
MNKCLSSRPGATGYAPAASAFLAASCYSVSLASYFFAFLTWSRACECEHLVDLRRKLKWLQGGAALFVIEHRQKITQAVSEMSIFKVLVMAFLP